MPSKPRGKVPPRISLLHSPVRHVQVLLDGVTLSPAPPGSHS